MDSILNCFGNIIGTSEGTPSTSGIYITDLEALSTVQGLIDAGEATLVQEELEKARRIAILRLNSDLSTLLLQFTKPRLPFSGKIGSSRYIKKGVDTGKSGVRLVCAPLKNATLTIKGISTFFTQAGALKVYVANNYDDVVHEYHCLTSENKVKINMIEPALSLPLFAPSTDYVEYHVYHENDFAYLDNSLSGCCGGKKFNFCYPPRFKQWGLESYLLAGGFNENIRSTVNSGKGLILEVDIKCDLSTIICADEIDYMSNPVAQAMAQAIMYKAGSVVIWNILRNTKLNRVLMTAGEDARDAASYYERKYNDIIKFIVKNMPIQHDCLCEQGFTQPWIGRIG